MTKAEFINKIQANTGDKGNQWSKSDCSFAVDAIFKTIIEEVANGEKISIAGFGNFETINVSEKIGINPQTKEKITIPATKRPKFKVGKIFRDAVRGVRCE